MLYYISMLILYYIHLILHFHAATVNRIFGNRNQVKVDRGKKTYLSVFI